MRHLPSARQLLLAAGATFMLVVAQLTAQQTGSIGDAYDCSDQCHGEGMLVFEEYNFWGKFDEAADAAQDAYMGCIDDNCM